MRGKKSKILKSVITNQLLKMKVEGIDDLFQRRYEPFQYVTKNMLIRENNEPKIIQVEIIQPIKLEFCFRRAYQSLKDTLKSSGSIKNVKRK